MSSTDVLINLMVRNEELISRIYRAFSVHLPELGKFWETMSLEENGHAEILKNLGKKVAEGKVSVSQRKISADQIMEMLEYLEGVALQVEKKGTNSKKALSIAFELEDAMLEKSIFDVFEGDSSEIKHDFKLLSEHTKQHRIRLEQALKAASE